MVVIIAAGPFTLRNGRSVMPLDGDAKARPENEHGDRDQRDQHAPPRAAGP